ncbi:DNA photolyase family protein [Suttonella sp. R2A3]|uniref:cryptochrome/photolyase family protein n=1 Tax=Suttonella sp. R2A3 TaxID=2908648 RepID=UPI001F1F6F3A|nr:deoxyribodipyrimidine photo-lyase [Suttonella sp. R2A3]UJF24509.1 DNA photolyase family protein [Suttonella sp. R2A3]
MATLYLFRGHDLRLADNPTLQQALRAAQAQRAPLYLAYVDESDKEQSQSAVDAWRALALAKLSGAIEQLGGSLCRIEPHVLLDTINKSSINAVFWNRRYDPESIAADRSLKTQLQSHNIVVHSSPGNVLFEPFDPRSFNQSDQPYRVYTPFSKRLRVQLNDISEPLSAPSSLSAAKDPINQSMISKQVPVLPAWVSAILKIDQAGEQAALRHAADWFATRLNGYSSRRDFPAEAQGTSKLSRYLNIGTLSPKQVLHLLNKHQSATGEDSEHFIRELLWREFAYHILYHFPDTAHTPFQSKFNSFNWREANEHQDWVRAWQQGRTGVPLVDAGMRELWTTGWMHNRVRMVTASWLTKNLRLHWQAGAKWFMHTLIDADIASNTLGWQWVAGCGVDAAPYFRIFNPLTQAEKFDPEVHYLKQWLPELRGLSAKQCFAPWTHTDYPQPMVDIKGSRKAALAAYKTL